METQQQRWRFPSSFYFYPYQRAKGRVSVRLVYVGTLGKGSVAVATSSFDIREFFPSLRINSPIPNQTRVCGYTGQGKCLRFCVPVLWSSASSGDSMKSNRMAIRVRGGRWALTPRPGACNRDRYPRHPGNGSHREQKKEKSSNRAV